MPKVIINGAEYDAQVGERLSDVARRNGAHMGFVCEGLMFFLFQTNLCRVVKGADNLSAPNELETNWLPQSWLDAGYRMGCEVKLQSAGPVEIISYAEELRRSTINVFSAPAGTTFFQNTGTLIKDLGNVMVGQLARFPFNIAGAVPIWVKRVQNHEITATCLPHIGLIVKDASRVVRNMTGPSTPRATKILVETGD